MAICFRSISVVLSLGLGTALAQAPKPAKSAPPTVVQPGAPGKRSTTITPAAAAATTAHKVHDADVAFMQGMIHHHAQAVEMVDLLRTRVESPSLRAFGERIAISQTDEIQYMKDWLTERGKPVMDHSSHAGHEGHAMAMPLMPGMLTPAQMAALAKAKGAEFDRLFLTGMIQHHEGALTMVDELFAVPGAGQDAALYDFASDIDNTQRAEIDIMRAMLKEKK
jgi:uncharacterized protein (DUF305 family)